VVGAKLTLRIRDEDKYRPKSYMLHMRCPTGLLVNPDTIEVFRDAYTAHSENSAEQVGPFAAPKTWDIFRVPHHGSIVKGPRDATLGFRF
jgi:hypothetical protein